jgi:hypothetical protein
MKIAIHGLAKSGTSALFALLQEAMPEGTEVYFEPGRRHRWQYLRRRSRQLLPGPKRPLLTKDLPFATNPNRRNYDFGPFDHSILILRDPRDRLISYLLYLAYDSSLAAQPAAAAKFVRLLERKERDPAATGLCEIVRAITEVTGRATSFETWMKDYSRHSIAAPITFADTHPDLIQIRYEDLVDGNLASLSETLGLSLGSQADVGPELQRVVRTRSYGNWADWFTEADIELFRPLLQPYLDRHYPEADWNLKSVPRIAPEHASRYVLRILSDRRRVLGLGPWPAGSDIAHYA